MTKTLYDPVVEEKGIKKGVNGIISMGIRFRLTDDEILNELKINLNINDKKAK